ncbi:MAG: outer membrane lipoprotein-sorting protein [Gammaproteobacteria bacterium]|nr:MAG: outer membrane lipoprotein-sorting protein [Gammaproteobacteria bacterium]
MKKLLFLPLLLGLSINLSQAQTTPQQMLETADKYRLSSDNMQVSTTIKLYKNDKKMNQKEYMVFIKPERKSLVLFLNPTEKGQKVLMLQNKFWMLMPKSRRPIRITPLQKLLGEASTGDIATMQYADDYNAKLEKTDDKNHILWLEAKDGVEGLTYKNIRLFLSIDKFAPTQAEFYVSSGKLAKTAEFITGKLDGTESESVVKMTLKDKINKNRYTEVIYNSRKDFVLSNKFYNPAYLVKNPQINY